jgi:hypothetical protein
VRRLGGSADVTGDDGSPCGVIAQMMGEGIVAVPIEGCRAANMGCNMLEIRLVPGDNEVTIDETILVHRHPNRVLVPSSQALHAPL